MNRRATRGRGIFEGFLARRRATKVNRLVPSDARSLLDIGCGSHPLFLLQTTVPDRRGLDKMVPPEGRVIDGVTLVHHDVHRTPLLPFEDQSFDVITMLAVFEHIRPQPLALLLREINRVLRPGGSFIMTTPAGWTDPLLRAMARVGLVSPEEIDEHQDRYDRLIIRRYLRAAGFPPDQTATGSFLLGMNLWAAATTPILNPT